MEKRLQNADYLVRLWEALEKGTLVLSQNKYDFCANQKKGIKLLREQIHVYVKPGTNLDAGTYDEENEWVRYGAKHDILARIGDLIRYQLKFDPRPDIKFQKRKILNLIHKINFHNKKLKGER